MSRQPPPSVLALMDEAVQRFLDAGGPYRARVCTAQVVSWLMSAGWVRAPDSREDLPTGKVLGFRTVPQLPREDPVVARARLHAVADAARSDRGAR